MKTEEITDAIMTEIGINLSESLEESIRTRIKTVLDIAEASEWTSVDKGLPEEHDHWILGWEEGLIKSYPCSFNIKSKKFTDAEEFEVHPEWWRTLPERPKTK